jgi:hypothetical protein
MTTLDAIRATPQEREAAHAAYEAERLAWHARKGVPIPATVAPRKHEYPSGEGVSGPGDYNRDPGALLDAIRATDAEREVVRRAAAALLEVCASRPNPRNVAGRVSDAPAPWSILMDALEQSRRVPVRDMEQLSLELPDKPRAELVAECEAIDQRHGQLLYAAVYTAERIRNPGIEWNAEGWRPVRIDYEWQRRQDQVKRRNDNDTRRNHTGRAYTLGVAA